MNNEITFEFNTFEDASDFLKNEKLEVSYKLLDAISEGIKNNDLVVTALSLKANGRIYSINIKRDNFNRTLDKCIKIFEDYEKYELCSFALELKNNY